MESSEVKKELNMTYKELVEHLLKKYGPSEYDYFSNESCKSRNPKISRTSEGLYCHHIDEDKAILLSKDKFAKISPWEYQKADRLVYCNVLEHLILHIKIVEEPQNLNANEDEIQGLGGVITICPEINDFFNGYSFQKHYLIDIFKVVKTNFEVYIEILKYFFNIIDKRPLYKKYITRESISRASDSQIVKRVYNELTKTNYSNEIKKPKNNVSYSTGKKITNKAADKLINKGLNALFKNLFK